MTASDSEILKEHSSFRDPAGFVFVKDGVISRQINTSGLSDYRLLKSSGLYDDLVSKGLLIESKEEEKHDDLERKNFTSSYIVITHPKIPFISYPYEWCFGQLKAAAILTLEIQKAALMRGLTLKDASAFNVQFIGTKPVFIDTLSFEKYKEGKAWAAYRQFCQHFLAPLVMASLIDINMLKLWSGYIDGIPLELSSKATPLYKLLLKPSVMMHLTIHSWFQSFDNSKRTCHPENTKKISYSQIMSLVDNLIDTINSLSYKPKGYWKNYYSAEINNYSPESLDSKKQIVSEIAARITPPPQIIWDIGSNNGEFSRRVINHSTYLISIDSDYNCVEDNYRKSLFTPYCKNILPLVIDIANPTPWRGWQNMERKSLLNRSPADMVMALALCHHLAFRYHINFKMMAKLFQQIADFLIIEFIPPNDSQAVRMIGERYNTFSWYKKENFEEAFAKYFNIIGVFPIKKSIRIIYLMRKK